MAEPRGSATDMGLVRTSSAGTGRAAGFPGVNMPAVAAARRVGQVGETCSEGYVVDVHPITQTIVGKNVKRRIEHSHDCAQGDVRYVVKKPPAIGIARRISTQQTKTANIELPGAIGETPVFNLNTSAIGPGEVPGAAIGGA